MGKLELWPCSFVKGHWAFKLFIWLSCKSYEPFSIHINSKWLEWSHTNIDPQVKLIPIDQEWIVYVLADNHIVRFVNIRCFVCHVNSSALTPSTRFHDPKDIQTFLLNQLTSLQKLIILIWYDEWLWKDVEILYFLKDLTHLILSCYFKRVREVIHLLIFI